MKLHALGIPHTVTSKEYLSCAFTQKVLKFCDMMKDEYEIIHRAISVFLMEKGFYNREITKLFVGVKYFQRNSGTSFTYK